MNKKEHVLFLVNPFSGNKKAQQNAEIAIKAMEDNGFETSILISKSIGDLSSFTNQFNSNKITKIAILGGDGTMHEVVNAVIKKPEWLAIPLLLFPCGTGNAFNYDQNCLTIKKAIDLLLNGKISSIDLAEIKMNNETIWSFNIIGCGLVADINLLAEKMRWLGAARYNIASLFKILFNQTINASVTINNEIHEGEFCFLLACNTRYTGKAMKMAPKALLNDGLIDLLMVKKTSRFKLISLFPKVFSGKHLSSPILKYVQTNRIIIETKHSNLVNIDGEIKGSTPMEIIMHQKLLKIIS